MLDGCSLRRNGAATKAETPNGTHGDTYTNTHSISTHFPAGIQPVDLDIYTEAMAALFKSLVALPGLRRAPGAQGHLKGVSLVTWNGQIGRQGGSEEGQMMYMTSDRSSFWPVPTTMNIVWDSE